MPKFCGKCGARLDEKTGLCPNCDADRLKELQEQDAVQYEDEAQEQERHAAALMPPDPDQNDDRKSEKHKSKTEKRAKRAQMAAGKKARRVFLKVLLSVLVLVVLAVCAAGVLSYFDVLDIPRLSYVMERSGLVRQKTVAVDPNADNYIPEEDAIAFDEGKNQYYANNEILVFFSNHATDEQKGAVVSYLNGEHVGTVPEMNMYQIKISESGTLAELVKQAEEICEKFDYVIYATYDAVAFHQNDAYAPNDPWEGDVSEDDWQDSTIDGSNWWIEAIDAQDAWEYQDRFNKITIGISDSSFDAGHEDLKNKVSFANELLESRNVVTPWWQNDDNWKDVTKWGVASQQNYHGTHVAGIIGAEGDNKKGITGLVQNSEILLAPYYKSEDTNVYYAWDSSTYANLACLVKSGAKVVNFSQGKTNFLEEETGKMAYSADVLEREGNIAAIAVSQLISSGYEDFLIVQSAGNGTHDTGKAVDAVQNGWFASITDKSITASDRTIEDVRSHVIIVGAAEQTESGFQCTSFSNYGEQVDICAPGREIYSTIPGEIFFDFQFFGGYGDASGTSMSAPIVTGVCALAWSANPALSAKQVKDIVCGRCDTMVAANPENGNTMSYNLVNAKIAVKTALDYAAGGTQAGEYEMTDIPDDAVGFNGHYYYAYPANNAASWNLAAQYCADQNGYLATITSQEENDFLLSYIQQKGFDQAYFGLSQTGEEDGWRWVNDESLDYTNWGGDGAGDGGYALLSGSRAQDIVSSSQASSELDEKSANYSPDLAVDGDSGTAWVEGVDGQGMGESITLTFDQVYRVSGLDIRAGYQKSTDLYYKNSRPKTITVEFSDGTSEQCDLRDVNDKQTIFFSKPVATDRLTIRIDSVYAGNKYTDTAISEVFPIAYSTASGSWKAANYAGAAADSTTAFLCEWGKYQTDPLYAERTTSDERDIVLVLDVSGSMSGQPMEETQKAASNFAATILKEDASIGIVTYEGEAERLSEFSMDQSKLQDTIYDIRSGGDTNMEAGLAEAKSMLDSSGARQKIIVLMSDGEPNEGKTDDELIAYADQLKDAGITIYTLGFFDKLSSKANAQALMEQIASEGCHYEVSDADSLVFFFGDIADQINGQKYIYIRIACPVDVSVTYQGETLDSRIDAPQTRTSFGTLTFEESDEEQSDAEEGTDNRIKTLRLKDGAAYDIHIVGNGRGRMDYTIGFMDEQGEYSDLRRFHAVRINRRTVIDTVAENADATVLNVDEDGDGKYDLKYRAKANETGELVDYTPLICAAAAAAAVLFVTVSVLVYRKRARAKKGTVSQRD